MSIHALSNGFVLVANGFITYFVALLAAFGLGGITYGVLLVLLIASAILFTIYPKRKFSQRPMLNFSVKLVLHAVTSYTLLVIMGQFAY